jgi:hypothetical protein
MSESVNSFAEEIEANRTAEQVSAETVGLATEHSSLGVRLRGCFITECELTSPTSGERVAVLYSSPDLTVPKLTATHIMAPAGPYDGIGGQHGPARWADYQEIEAADSQNGAKRVVMQAKRSDAGTGIIKSFELSDSALESSTQLWGSDTETEHTSMGEHSYFTLDNEEFDGLTVNGKSLDELMGEGSLDAVKTGGTLNWQGFGGEAIIEFPAGHQIKLSADFVGNSKYPVVLWIWHRPDSPSICFEPVVGVAPDNESGGLELSPYNKAVLYTRIELLEVVSSASSFAMIGAWTKHRFLKKQLL